MKTKRLTGLIALFLLILVRLNAQNQDFKNVLTFNAGFSLVSNLISLNDYVNTDAHSYSIPAIQLNYDRAVENWVSVGLACSYQRMGIEFDHWQGTNNNYETQINRYNFAARTLFHYANNGKVDLYSGLRLGFTKWHVTTTNTDPSYNPDDDFLFNHGVRFAPQLILFGMRLYAFENLGLNYEFGIGPPHYFSLGLAYRIH